MPIEKRAIKFYLDASVNDIKQDKILRFLRECQDTQNNLYKHYWEHFDVIINNKKYMSFSYQLINYKTVIPKLKSHHYYQVAQQVFGNLKTIQTTIINKMHFKFKQDKDKQRVYNYCVGFCFNWDYLVKYTDKQLKSYKKKDNKYYEFLLLVKSYIDDTILFAKLKEEIENRFWEIKDKYTLPNKKEFQIACNTNLSIKNIEIKEFQWIFEISSNDVIGGTDRKPTYDRMIIPVKFTNYHKEKLNGKKLANTFNLKLNKYGKIEIIGIYEIEVDYKVNEVKDTIGIDIGLKKLITCSDGEVVEQNKNILHKLSKIVKHQGNRQTLEKHLQKKYDNEDFRLDDKRYLRKQAKLSNFIKCDNRFRIKQFLKGREHDHIIMEDLKIGYSKTHSKQVNYLLKRMGMQYIKSDILKYCKEQGIKTSLINASYTSQQCPICGHVSKDNRKTQETFYCVKCGHTDNADFNASINIKNRINEKRIKLNTPIWLIKEILGIEEIKDKF